MDNIGKLKNKSIDINTNNKRYTLINYHPKSIPHETIQQTELDPQVELLMPSTEYRVKECRDEQKESETLKSQNIYGQGYQEEYQQAIKQEHETILNHRNQLRKNKLLINTIHSMWDYIRKKYRIYCMDQGIYYKVFGSFLQAQVIQWKIDLAKKILREEWEEANEGREVLDMDHFISSWFKYFEKWIQNVCFEEYDYYVQLSYEIIKSNGCWNKKKDHILIPLDKFWHIQRKQKEEKDLGVALGKSIVFNVIKYLQYWNVLVPDPMDRNKSKTNKQEIKEIKLYHPSALNSCMMIQPHINELKNHIQNFQQTKRIGYDGYIQRNYITNPNLIYQIEQESVQILNNEQEYMRKRQEKNANSIQKQYNNTSISKPTNQHFISSPPNYTQVLELRVEELRNGFWRKKKTKQFLNRKYNLTLN